MLHWLKNFFVKTLFGFNILASVLLFCVYLAAWTPPSQFHYFAILAIGYPLLLFVNFIFAAWWLYQRQRYFYLSTVVLILGWSHFLNFFGVTWFNSSPTPNTVRVLTYNTHYFNGIGSTVYFQTQFYAHPRINCGVVYRPSRARFWHRLLPLRISFAGLCNGVSNCNHYAHCYGAIAGALFCALNIEVIGSV